MCNCDCELSKYDRWRRVEAAHARRLAEKARDENPDRSSDWSEGVDWVIALIDPEVEL